MKIFIDIGHPAHVHYFRNMINLMRDKGHTFFIVARDKDVTHSLLDNFNLPYISRGKGGESIISKFCYLFKADYKLLMLAKKFKPDIFLSFASPYAAHVSYVMNKPHIAFTDTEHATLGNLVFSKFTNTIVTPKCFKKQFGKKHIRFNGYMELSYLHPDYFKPDKNILELLKIKKDENYTIVRFVSWNASHDIGYSGLACQDKINLIKKLSRHCKVFVSSESALPDEIKKFQLNIPSNKMHDVLFFASLFIGEGATMASEAGVLGTPSICVKEIEDSTCNEQEKKYGLLYNYKNINGIIDKSIEILNSNNKYIFQNRRNKMLNDKINVTKFMVWLLEKFPKSVEDLKSNSDINNFN